MREWRARDPEVGDVVNIYDARRPGGLWLAVHDITLAFVLGVLTGASFVTWTFR